MTSQPIRVCIVGHVCIDENSDEHSLERDETDVVRDAASTVESARLTLGPPTRTPGSPAVFMVREFSALTGELQRGVETSILAPHGNDFRRLSPSTPLITAPSAAPTLLYRNFFVDGRRRQECRNIEHARPAPLDHAARVALGEADIVIVAPLLDTFGPDDLDALFSAVSPSALRVLLPQGYFRRVEPDHSIQQADFDTHGRVLPHFDLVVYSDEDCDNALRRAIEWSAQSPRTRIVVTQGDAGATAVENGQATPVTATTIAPIDSLATIGAGDVFSAHLTMAYFARRDLAAAVRMANDATAGFLVKNQSSLVRPEGELLAG